MATGFCQMATNVKEIGGGGVTLGCHFETTIF